MGDFDFRGLQLAELNMLKDIAKFCDDNNIVYFLDAGTLLGAVRGGEFIPWDDDIDICMDVKNYKKFVKLAKFLPEKYFFQSYKTDHKYALKWAKIRINGTTSMERNMTNYDIHYGVCMDIFVYSGIRKSKLFLKLQSIASVLENIFLQKYYLKIIDEGLISSKWKLLYKIPEKIRILLISVLKKFSLYDTHKANQCFSNFYLLSSPDNVIIPSSFLKENNRIKVKFEDGYFYITKDFEKFLELRYGDWRTLPPEEERYAHGDIIVDLKNDYKMYYTGE